MKFSIKLTTENKFSILNFNLKAKKTKKYHFYIVQLKY
jgi:hypothetical protein